MNSRCKEAFCRSTSYSLWLGMNRQWVWRGNKFGRFLFVWLAKAFGTSLEGTGWKCRWKYWLSMLCYISLASGREEMIQMKYLFMLIIRDAANEWLALRLWLSTAKFCNLDLALANLVTRANYLTFLYLGLLNCKMKKIIVFTLKKKTLWQENFRV